jgi:hypothetical protein
LRATQPFELSLLKDAEQFGLQFERDISDFVQKQSAAVCGFETTHFACHGAREGSSFVAEELALHESYGNGRTIQFHEGPIPACAVVMNGASDEFLPCPGFAFDESSGITRRDRPNEIQHLTESPACSQDGLKPLVHAFALLCLTTSRYDSLEQRGSGTV